MKLLFAALTIALVTVTAPVCAQRAASDAHLERAKRILRSTPLVDGHNDLPWAIRTDTVTPRDVVKYDLRTRTRGHTDLARLREGMVGAQFWSIYIPSSSVDSGAARMQLEQIDIARRIIEMYPEFEWALTASEIRRVFRQGKIGSMLGLEGGHAIENSLGALRAYYEMGARYMTLTHSANIDWADAATDTVRHGGLTEFGREVVREMNRMGMLVDLSHTSPGTMSDALDVAAAPVIFSHSSVRALTEHTRNVPDSILRRLPTNGGVVMVTFVPAFVSNEVAAWYRKRDSVTNALRVAHPNDEGVRTRELATWRSANPTPKATMAQVADHIDHVRKVAGADHVGIGGDFDGIDEGPVGLEDVSTYPMLFAELARRGWSDADLRKLAGENLLRVMARAEVVAARLQGERAPSTKTIEELDGKRAN